MTTQTITEEQLNLYQSLFRGRTDVYARYWEKNGQANYSPAYDVNWTAYNKYKSTGGSFKDFKDKKLIFLTPGIVKKHLIGSHAIGIYPILQDNTSYFIAADFDGSNWQQDCKNSIDECQKAGLHAYLERSRSGNGGHVWMFLEIIRRALKLSEFDKEVSFDRLFPNQDSLAKEGFGNLIAIPMQGQATRLSNTLFLNPETFQPYSDQWAFLQTIHKHTIAELESAYANVLNKTVSFTPEVPGTSSISLILNSKIVLNRSELTPLLIHFLKEKLNFISTEYLTKKRLGKSVYKVQKFFKLLEENGDDVLLPRGFLSQLISFLRNNGIAYQLKEQRPQILEVKFTSNIKLLPAQQPIVGKALEVDSGVIVAPSGSGKTIIGLEIIAQRKLPALILVHRKQLLDQWIERTQSFLEIPKKDIGQYYSVKKKTGEQITVAMMQTLVRIGNFAELQNKFGTIIVDECHHTPAKTFREVIGQLNPKYIYGLTATPKRKHNDEPLIYMFIGNIIAQMEHAPEIIAETPELSYKSVKTQIIIRETNLEVPFKFTTDNFQLLAKLICFDTNRNQMIVKDIQEQTSQGKKVLFLSERRDHLEILSLYLKGLCETITISGEDSNAKRAIKLKQVQTGHYQAILSTGQFFGEGLDIPGIDCLIIAFPFSFEGKLIQYIGRLRGKDNQKIIIDYEDKKIAFLERQFKRRKRYYNKISKS
ncbi:MAG: hypothetical protein A2445_02705 [Candidatus Jacksonbacteria bacterium RIFOXYC2_FULL_44_29]|nr:MAG: Type III restriction enzyme, res subunit:DEAD/DEAH box helicase [Parcubacteria group bacterium GW2011_GWA2_42_28]KKT55912.1 MAG: Type III restriction enzyme, res subunit:DEAD/DEAH box helicase [Parcubacteria group bacterium GW2011_GWC2_44_22]OGY78207.1 MAG: hypothetical protein A2550_06255 [Candidatus Jacksonbacteria bacterium RIFOXYD2_FULL_43_21]OGY80785.1 MAG: hypothetical protein A2445_02705 [Candidatus Jacksonbacteria bacterium RIFOXYC2_FULL_44_29]HCC49544.1 restriction endonuclease